jgi:hypothetical protein
LNYTRPLYKALILVVVLGPLLATVYAISLLWQQDVSSLFCQVGREAWNKFMIPVSSAKPARRQGISKTSSQGKSKQK